MQIVSNGGSSGSGASTNDVVTTSHLSSDFPVTAAYSDVAGAGMTAVTGLACTITTTRTNEVVQIFYSGSVNTSGAATDMIYGYKIGSGTAVVIGHFYHGAVAFDVPLSFCIPVTITGAPGDYTIYLVASKNTGSPQFYARLNSNGDYYLFGVKQKP